MKIDLEEKIYEHLDRIESLAREAAFDDDERFSSRAAAMTAMTTMLKDLVKSQKEIYNISRQQALESALIETVKETMSEKQYDTFLNKFEEALRARIS